MKGPMIFKVFLVIALASVLQIVPSPMVSASRDEDTRAVEVAAGSHFARKKDASNAAATSHADHKPIHKHQDRKSGTAMSPLVRKRLLAFSRAARRALANRNNPHMSSEQKAASVRAALAKASHLVTQLSSNVNAKKNPALARKLKRHLASLHRDRRMISPSLMQEQEEEEPRTSISASSVPAITPEMRDQIAAFGKAAVQALNEKKASSVEAALAQAANAVSLIAPMASTQQSPTLTKQLADLKGLAAPSLIQKRQEDAPDGNMELSSDSRVTPELREQVLAFSKIATQALSNNANPDMSKEEKGQHIQTALAKAAQVMTSMAEFADKKKAPELEQHLATLRQLTQ